MPFIPHTPSDERAMLDVIGVGAIDNLLDEIPNALRVGPLPGIPAALTEMQVGRLMAERAALDGRVLNFIGAGAYEHHIPAAVWSTVTRGEIYSAYTPYQAEASQGTLQIIFEYQTMMASLTAMEVSNASLYDGASALAEACLMAVRANRRSKSSRIVLPRTLHPHYEKCVRSVCGLQNLIFETLPFDSVDGTIVRAALSELEEKDVTAIVIQQPNFFGSIEDVDDIVNWAHARGALVIAVVNPVSLAVLRPPGEWGEKGADIVVGDGQPLGVPLSGGGPYFGFMTTRMEHVRQMPGRIVGRTIDLDGRTGYALTLQAREQHIRRSKATSNICTNQGLLMSAATIYLSIVGAEGLERVANACIANTALLLRRLADIPGVRPGIAGSRFHEAVVIVDVSAKDLLTGLASRGIAGGFDLSVDYPELGQAILVCATETKTEQDIDEFVEAFRDVMETLNKLGGSL